jgi:hypothetical protein
MDLAAWGRTMASHRRRLEKLEGQMEELRRKTGSAFHKLEGVKGIRKTKVRSRKMATKSRAATRRKSRGL